MQRRFFDHFLRGEQNGWEETPRVTLAVSRSREVCDVRGAPNWPLPEVHYRPLSLDAASGTLCADPPAHEGVICRGIRLST